MKNKIIIKSKIDSRIKAVIYPIEHFKNAPGYHLEFNNKAFSPLELFDMGFIDSVNELRPIAHEKAFKTNYFIELLNQLNPDNIPMIETDFYNWMKKGNYKNNIIENKTHYLKSKGFIKGKHKINKKLIRTLGYIAVEFFRREIKPILLNKDQDNEKN